MKVDVEVVCKLLVLGRRDGYFDPPQHRVSIEVVGRECIRFFVVVVPETNTVPAVVGMTVSIDAVSFCSKLHFTPQWYACSFHAESNTDVVQLMVWLVWTAACCYAARQRSKTLRLGSLPSESFDLDRYFLWVDQIMVVRMVVVRSATIGNTPPLSHFQSWQFGHEREQVGVGESL